MQKMNEYMSGRRHIKRPFSLALPFVCIITLGALLAIDPMPTTHAAVFATILPLPTVSAQPLMPANPVTTKPTLATAPPPAGGVPAIAGQLILVSESQQWLWVYQDRQLVYATPITTGRPGLTTPTGIFHILSKAANLTFYSPWPPNSPFYYMPEHINFALYFHDTGFYIHDAPWRSEFGPGSNIAHLTVAGASETGSHGCVNVPTNAGAWLYHWAAIGASIDIVG
jgi:lipoprotein-anchoring transpeptidase ErfK/SrfK